MASFASSILPNIQSLHRKPISLNLLLTPSSVTFPLNSSRLCIRCAIKTGSNGIVVRSGQDSQSDASYMLRKPVISPSFDGGDGDGESAKVDSYYESENKSGDGDTLVDLEDQILAVTVPLVDIVRIILHSGKYENGDKLSPEHKRTILERLLPYHPEFVKKIGCGVDYITIDDHPNFEGSRCLFIVRNDGELVDFSYSGTDPGSRQVHTQALSDTIIEAPLVLGVLIWNSSFPSLLLSLLNSAQVTMEALSPLHLEIKLPSPTGELDLLLHFIFFFIMFTMFNTVVHLLR